MEYRELGRPGWTISTVDFGAWAIGGDAWGGADDILGATRAGWRLQPHPAAGDDREDLTRFVERRLPDLGPLDNASAADLPVLTDEFTVGMWDVYDRRLRAAIHHPRS